MAQLTRGAATHSSFSPDPDGISASILLRIPHHDIHTVRPIHEIWETYVHTCHLVSSAAPGEVTTCTEVLALVLEHEPGGGPLPDC